MMGVPIEGLTHMYGDNMSTFTTLNALIPSIRRNPTAFVIMALERQWHENPADLLTQGCGWRSEMLKIPILGYS